RIFERLAHFAGSKDILTGQIKFDQRFALKGSNAKAIRSFFTKECTDFLMRNPSFHMESNGTALLIFHKERVASVQEFKLMVNFVLDWAEQMSTPSE
ncbi:MAG TPA: sulfate transporter, partial [Cryomorphaceae bacterium]|nr:sulfate transporter [Cryomorphaceae bacterium]